MRPVSCVVTNSCENTRMFTSRFLQCRRLLLILTHQIKSDKFYCKSHTPKSMSALIITPHFKCRGRSDNLDPPFFLCCMWVNFCCKPWLQNSNNCMLLLVSCLAYSSTLKMELVHSLECWWTVLHCYNPVGRTIHSRCCKNLKFSMGSVSSAWIPMFIFLPSLTTYWPWKFTKRKEH
jgi:hypothetical protein